MKVASIFGKKNERKTAESFIKQAKNTELTQLNENFQTQNPKSSIPKIDQISSSFIDSQNLNEDEEKKKAKYIFAAINKAEERKFIQEEVKQKRFQRELEKWEKEHGKMLKFSTFNDGDNQIPSNIENDMEINDDLNEENKENKEQLKQKNHKSIIPSEEEFEAMRERYLERLKTTGILQFPSGKKAQVELLYYPEICGIPIITET